MPVVADQRGGAAVHLLLDLLEAFGEDATVQEEGVAVVCSADEVRLVLVELLEEVLDSLGLHC